MGNGSAWTRCLGGRPFRGWWAAAAVIAVMAAPAGAETRQPEDVLVVGTARVIEGNMAGARERAVSQGLRKGLEQYVLGHLGREGAVNNFERIVREIFPSAGEQILNYHVLAERRMEETYALLLQVRINAKVVEQRMKSSGVVVLEGPPVKLLFLVSETSGDALRCWWEHPEAGALLSPLELALHRAFQERGFAPVNRVLGSPDVPEGIGLRDPEPSVEAARTWGRLYGADVVLTGRMHTDSGGRLVLVLKAVEVASGDVMAQAGGSEPSGDLPEAAVVALAREVAGKLAPGIFGAVGAERSVPHRLSVTLLGITSYQQFNALKGFLENDVRGVLSVVPTRIKRNAFTLAVEFQGDRAAFQDRVLHHERLPYPLDLMQGEGNDAVIFHVR